MFVNLEGILGCRYNMLFRIFAKADNGNAILYSYN